MVSHDSVEYAQQCQATEPVEGISDL